MIGEHCLNLIQKCNPTSRASIKKSVNLNCPTKEKEVHGNTFTRTIRLAKHLITHPRDIFPYLITGPLCKKTPFGLGVPWFSNSAIRFLEDYTKPSMRVFEYGAGGSSIFFASKGAEVISTEDHALWYEKIKSELEKKDLRGGGEEKPSNYMLSTSGTLKTSQVLITLTPSPKTKLSTSS